MDPTPETCADSIDQRETSNEWRIADYVPVGIFILPPIFVRQAQTLEGLHEPILAEVGLSLEQAIAPFPDQRILSANARTFLEFERAAQDWKPIAYDDIIRPRTSADSKTEKSIGPGESAAQEDRPIG